MLNLGCIFTILSNKGRNKNAADHYNIVCEVLHDNNNRLHALMTWADAGMPKKGGLF